MESQSSDSAWNHRSAGGSGRLMRISVRSRPRGIQSTLPPSPSGTPSIRTRTTRYDRVAKAHKKETGVSAGHIPADIRKIEIGAIRKR